MWNVVGANEHYTSEKERNIRFKKKTVFKIRLPSTINIVYFWVINVNWF
jgi:hypothetical protein